MERYLMKFQVYKSTNKKLIGYTLKCSQADLNCLLDDRHGDFTKGDDTIHVDYDNIKRLDGYHFIIKNPNFTIWVKSNKYIPVGAFGPVEGLIR